MDIYSIFLLNITPHLKIHPFSILLIKKFNFQILSINYENILLKIHLKNFIIYTIKIQLDNFLRLI